MAALTLMVRYAAWKVLWAALLPFMHIGSYKSQLGQIAVLIPLSNRERAHATDLKIRQAFALVAETDARRHRMLLRAARRLLVVESRQPGYVQAMNMIVLGSQEVISSSLPVLAMCLIHEACHARVHRRGIWYTSDNAEQIERLCVREEVRFASRLTDGDRLSEWAHKSLESRSWEKKWPPSRRN